MIKFKGEDEDRDTFLGRLQRRQVQVLLVERFEDLEQLAHMTEFNIKQRHAELVSDAVIDNAAGVELEDHDVYQYQEEYRRLTQDFPQLLRATLIASTQAALEFFLLRIAHTCAKVSRSTFVQADWDRVRIWAVKKYMEDAHGKAGLPYWAKIADYISIRNAISHGDSHITDTLKNRPQVEAAAERLKPHVKLIHVDKSSDVKIELDQEAVEDFIKTAKQLCRELLNSNGDPSLFA